jgi:hypothetical protein
MRLMGLSSGSLRRIAQAVAVNPNEQPMQPAVGPDWAPQGVDSQQVQDINDSISYLQSAISTMEPYEDQYEFDAKGNRTSLGDFVAQLNSMVEFLTWFNQD